jgi:mono/diheme cytochrome c family protein
MKRSKIPVYLIFALIVCLVGMSAVAQEKTVKRVPPVGTSALDGKGLYQQFCASCHGKDAKGGGPAADALKQRPTDLTQISRQNGGKFPDTRIMAVLKGDQAVGAHGSQEMPTWGKTFNDISGNLSVSQGRMHALVMYLEEIQAK